MIKRSKRAASASRSKSPFSSSPQPIFCRSVGPHALTTRDVLAQECKRPAAPSSCDFRGDALPAIAQDGLGLVARDTFESFEEIIERQSVSKVIEESLDGQPRTAENRRAVQNARIGHDQSTGGGFAFGYSAHAIYYR